MLPGVTPRQSVENLYAWLDTVVIGMGLTQCLAMSATGQRIRGAYHHLSNAESMNLRAHFDIITRGWKRECLQGSHSAGMMVEIGGGSGHGRGLLTMTVIGVGPFLS